MFKTVIFTLTRFIFGFWVFIALARYWILDVMWPEVPREIDPEAVFVASIPFLYIGFVSMRACLENSPVFSKKGINPFRQIRGREKSLLRVMGL